MKLNSLFSEGMVLQRDIPIPVWGWAEPGESLTVSLAGQEQKARADGTGAFRAVLEALPAGGPHTLTVRTRTSCVSVGNVMVGEVWIASGQSNMEWTVALSQDSAAETAAAQHPDLRMFTVPKRAVVEPQVDTDGKWAVCNPYTVGSFSAVGYFFAREVQQRLGGIPVGIINTSWGGTLAEAWTSRERLLAEPELKAIVTEADRLMNDPVARGEYESRYAAWEKTLVKDSGDTGWARGWATLEASPEGWKTMDVPGSWQSKGMDFSGVFWFRREVHVPAGWAGQDLQLTLGPCDKSDITWFNNEQVGSITLEQRSDAWCTPRCYTVPGRLVRAGRNVVAVRIFSHMYAGGFIGNAGQMRLGPAGVKESEAIPLAGPWHYRVEADFGKINPQPPPAPLGNGNPNTPASLFNGMIAPLVPYPVRGAIWYQGESNAGRAHQYRTLFPVMIRDWRKVWAMPTPPERGAPGGEFAFHFVQLANWMPEQPQPGESAWAELREAQRLTLGEPNTGMAVIIDIGDANDIHPTNKQDVGRRLAYSALAGVYGQTLPSSGPMPREWESSHGVMRIRFDHTDGGLATHDGGPLRGFSVAGENRMFKWAWARIDGDSVLVRHPHVPNPVAVRYAWADNPACNLCNGAGLPATPFKTDDWPWTTQPKG